jgi:hypothetical protein
MSGPGAHAWAEISIIPQVQLFVKHFLRKSYTNYFSQICADYLLQFIIGCAIMIKQ